MTLIERRLVGIAYYQTGADHPSQPSILLHGPLAFMVGCCLKSRRWRSKDCKLAGMAKLFSQMQLRAIADALGDTAEGLSGSEIAHLLETARIADTDPAITKRHRVYNAFANHQNGQQDWRNIQAFIRFAMKPERYLGQEHRFEPLRLRLNQALSFAGMAVDEAGTLITVEVARTLPEARRRAEELRADLELRRVHPDVLRFCKEELLNENYFHAVLEATKSVADKLRAKTGLTDDGAVLVDRALGGDVPMWAINSLTSESEKSEQKGFANIVKGLFGMFRNTTAHAPKIAWAVNKDDAEEVFTLLSLVHKRIDGGHMPPRV